MCSYQNVAEELVQKDDLILLFVGSSCICAQEQVMWRDANYLFLSALISKSLSQPVIKYIHCKIIMLHVTKSGPYAKLTLMLLAVANANSCS